MKLGFVTAILPELSLEEVVSVAATEGYSCIEVMCWPPGGSDRRYAGVTHIDVVGLDKARAAKINDTVGQAGISISGLGYYPNPLTPDAAESTVCIEHLKELIRAAELLGLDVVNTFIGRDWTKSVDDNWPRFLEVWPPLVQFAADHGIRIGIENCPMFFGRDEWPGGKNLASSPAIWRRMFEDIPADNFGLNLDPSHLIWQRIDYTKVVRDFADRIFHVHAKDATVDRHALDEVGVLAEPLQWHTPKLPGLGDIDWGAFVSALHDIGYRGPVCVEVEDRAFEPELARRKLALRQSQRYLSQFITE